MLSLSFENYAAVSGQSTVHRCRAMMTTDGNPYTSSEPLLLLPRPPVTHSLAVAATVANGMSQLRWSTM